ncbi:MAG: glycosyltransferase [Bacilli bacterium]|nr:glycosyltransferase [Bacilli bacterium]
MKEKYKVSIIVPVYNGLEFLDKCVDCLVNQTYKNIEVIFSDDGSTDGSLEKIKDVVMKNKNFKYNVHNNVGQSKTRNIALEYATGDYVTYLDVDDYFDYDYVEKMLDNNKNYDIIIGGYRRVDKEGNITFEFSLDDCEWNRYRRATVWAKLYKTSFLKKHKIIFPDDRLYGEDVVYTMCTLSKTNKVLIIDYVGYNNLINENSITHKDKDKLINDVPKILNNIDSFIKNNKKYLTEKEKLVKYYYLKIFVNYLVEQAVFLGYGDLKRYYETSFGIIKQIFNKYGYKLTFVNRSEEPLKVNLVINIFIFCEKLRLINGLLFLLTKLMRRNIHD